MTKPVTITQEDIDANLVARGRNRKAYNRARQRARNAMRRMFFSEFEAMCPWGLRGSGECQSVLRELARLHPEEYRKVLVRELAKEDRTPAGRGTPVAYPCGTKRAWSRHVRKGENPRDCGPCRAWYEGTHPAGTCSICGGPCASRRVFCDTDCRDIGYALRSYSNFTAFRVNQARSKKRLGRSSAHDENVLREFKRTGRIERKRHLPLPADSKVRKLCEAKGLVWETLVAQAKERAS